VTIKHVRTKEACQKGYGGGKTNWCTAASGSGNLFDSYGESGKKMITIHHGETVYGVHEHEGGTIRDAENNAVSHQQRDSNNKRGPQQIHPDISKAMAKTPELTKTNLVSENPHFEPTQEHIDSAMKDPDGSAAISMLSSYKDHIKPHHIDAAMKHPNAYVAATALREHKDKITQEHIDAAMKHHSNVAITALREHKDKITQEHIDAAMKHPDGRVAEYALREHKDKITPDHITAAMKHPGGGVALTALREHKDKITQEHIDAAMKHPDGGVASAALRHHGDKIKPRHREMLDKKIHDAMKKPRGADVIKTMRSHEEHITQAHVDTALEHPDKTEWANVATHVARYHTEELSNYLERLKAKTKSEKTKNEPI